MATAAKGGAIDPATQSANQNAATNLGTATQATNAALGTYAGMTGYKPAQATAYTYNPSAYTAAQGGQGAQVTAQQAQNPALIAAGISNYMNPYENDVVNTAISDVNKVTQQQQQQNAAAASAAGAFGGSRHGLVEATTNNDAAQTIATMAANLRNTGWQQAAGLAGQDVANSIGVDTFNVGQGNNVALANQGATLADVAAKNAQLSQNAQMAQAAAAANAGSKTQVSTINADAKNTASQFNTNVDATKAAGLLSGGGQAAQIGGQYFDTAQKIAADQAAQGAASRTMGQQILDAASGMFSNFTSQPSSLVDFLNSAIRGNPISGEGNTSSTYKPGLFDYLGLGANTAASIMSGGASTAAGAAAAGASGTGGK